jgi:cephalosporin-C deacetylase-like acetyl esterase
MKTKIYYSILLLLFSCIITNAQPSKELVTIIIAPNHSDWTYNLGDRPEFSITVLKNNVPVENVAVSYNIQPDAGYQFIKILEEGTFNADGKPYKIKAKAFNQAGFLRCSASVTIDDKKYSSYTTVGFSPEKIKPTTTLPADFKEFWDKGLAELSKIPVNPKMTLLPERSTSKVDVYEVEIDNINGKIFGILCKPKKAGKYPAILHVPGAGIRAYYGDVDEAAEGFISFTIGIHGIPLTLDPSVYDNLNSGPLQYYWSFNLDDKDRAYYRRVYLGCVRAVDFIETLSDFDGETIGVTGGSQGGALSIITASLDKRIDYLAAFYPALSDLTGFLHGRAGGWPQWFYNNENTNKPEKIQNSKYFDVVNFARSLDIPGWYSWGYNDNVCPPTSMYAAYNVIPSKKELHVFQETQHWAFPEQRELQNKWLYEKLRKK